MTVTLVLPGHLADVLRELAHVEIETAAVILTRPVTNADGHVRLLATDVVAVPEHAYAERSMSALSITSDGYVPALARAEDEGATPLWFHTHPGEGASPKPSRRDRRVDEELREVFRLRAGCTQYGSVIMSHADGQIRFSRCLETDSGNVPIDRLLTVGPRLELVRNALAPDAELSPLFDRNVRAFGGAVQRTLADLRVAIVGCGGTGSSVAEQLVRLGVRDLVLVDPDRLVMSNITRVYGSGPDDVGELKVDIAARHLRRIAPELRVDTIPLSITVEAAARQLGAVDVVFGCTDDNAGRPQHEPSATSRTIGCPMYTSSTNVTLSTQGRKLGARSEVVR